MQNQTRVEEQVERILAGKITKRLAKLRAAEEGALGQSVAAVRVRHEGHGFARVHTTTRTIPVPVVAAVITKLGRSGLLRKISVAGRTFVARPDATREELVAAVKLSLGESRYSAYAATKPGRRRRYRDGETSFEMAKAMPLTDPGELHYSEGESAMTHEGSVAKDPFEAEIPSDTARARDARQAKPASKPIGPLARRRIDYQMERPGMAERNARKALRRHRAIDPSFRRWLAGEVLRRENVEAERAAI